MFSRWIAAYFGLFDTFCADPNGPETVDEHFALQKRLLIRTSSLILLAGIVWGILYLYLEEPLAALSPLGYSAISVISIVIYARTQNFEAFRRTQLLLILLLPFLLSLTLGGFANSSAVLLWSLLAPFGALVFGSVSHAAAWFVLYVALVVVQGLVEGQMRPENNIPPDIKLIFYVLNIGVVSATAFTLLYYFIVQERDALARLRREQEKTERLLLNVLPRQIAVVLREKDEPETIAEQYDSVSVLFADVVGFTPLAAQSDPKTMLMLLNEIFTHFDSLVEKYGLEKIGTIGDSYFVVSGAPRRRRDHARALACMALDMLDYMRQRRESALENIDLNTEGYVSLPPAALLQFRIGMHCGPVVAGVIGQRKFHYDLWGDTVNTASRMESHGEPGRIQITHDLWQALKDEFVCVPRGTVEVKGKGVMETWYLVAKR